MLHRFNQLFERLNVLAPFGPLALRLIVGFHLIYGVQDNIRSHERMVEFANFLQAFGFPFPMVSAHLSVYLQCLAGICFLLGLFTRPAGILMVVNFIIAILMVHLSDAYPAVFPALMMLCAAFYFSVCGAGPISVDARLAGSENGDS